MQTEVKDRFGDSEFFEHPYDYYVMLRERHPVFYSPTLQSWVISRFEDVKAIADNPELYSSAPPTNQTAVLASFSEAYKAMYEEAGLPSRVPTLVTTDGATHRRYRGMVQSYFSPVAAKKFEATLLEIIDGLIDEFIERGEVDICKDFCLLVPLFVICDLLGVPRTQIALMQAAGNASTDLAGAGILTEEQRRAAHARLIEFGLYMREFITKYRAEPADNLLSRLIHDKTPDGDHLTEQEILSLCMTLNVGGNETTTSALGNAIYILLQNPDLEARLRENREEIPKFVEEALRLESPVNSLMRWPREDVEIAGVKIKAGSTLHLRIPAANHDGAKFENPEEIRLDRPAARTHLAFGQGVHYCVGNHFARLEMKLALNRIFDRMLDLKLDESKGPVRRLVKTQTRAVEALPITFRKAPAA